MGVVMLPRRSELQRSTHCRMAGIKELLGAGSAQRSKLEYAVCQLPERDVRSARPRTPPRIISFSIVMPHAPPRAENFKRRRRRARHRRQLDNRIAYTILLSPSPVAPDPSTVSLGPARRRRDGRDDERQWTDLDHLVARWSLLTSSRRRVQWRGRRRASARRGGGRAPAAPRRSAGEEARVRRSLGSSPPAACS